jgi:hypothetical protein
MRTKLKSCVGCSRIADEARVVRLSAALMAVGTLTVSTPAGDLTPVLTIGAALFGAGVLQVPAWARRRREQFDRIAERLRDAIRS